MKISVIVPVRNEEESIRALLDALIGQTRKPDEIVITDGGSTDSTVKIIEEYAEPGASIHLIREEMALPGRGRNLAAEHASSEWLAFTDAGIRPAGTWLAELAGRVEQEPAADMVYGSWEPVTDSFFKECAAIAYLPPPTEFDGNLMRAGFIASAMMRRSVWQAVGGFPEHLRSAEDILFMAKVKEGNFRTVFAPRALVRWEIQPNLRRTFKRFASYSRHNLKAGLWRQWQANIFKYYAVVPVFALPALALSGWWWLGLTGALWLLMLTARSIVALRRNRTSYPAGVGRNALRLLLLVPLLATIDAATFIGSITWLTRDKLYSGSRRGTEDA
jgi:glycosyltransferase involved in cell wall biosynthesis